MIARKFDSFKIRNGIHATAAGMYLLQAYAELRPDILVSEDVMQSFPDRVSYYLSNLRTWSAYRTPEAFLRYAANTALGFCLSNGGYHYYGDGSHYVTGESFTGGEWLDPDCPVEAASNNSNSMATRHINCNSDFVELRDMVMLDWGYFKTPDGEDGERYYRSYHAPITAEKIGRLGQLLNFYRIRRTYYKPKLEEIGGGSGRGFELQDDTVVYEQDESWSEYSAYDTRSGTVRIESNSGRRWGDSRITGTVYCTRNTASYTPSELDIWRDTYYGVRPKCSLALYQQAYEEEYDRGDYKEVYTWHDYSGLGVSPGTIKIIEAPNMDALRPFAGVNIEPAAPYLPQGESIGYIHYRDCLQWECFADYSDCFTPFEV